MFSDGKPQVRNRGESISRPRVREALDRLHAASDEDRSGIIEEICAEWPEDDLGRAVAAMEADDADDSCQALLRESLLGRWTKRQPTEAAAWAAAWLDGPGREKAVTDVALAWNGIDSVAAWNWAISLPKDPARENALLSLCYECTRDQPALALDRVDAIGDGLERTRLMEHAFANLAATDPLDACKRADGVMDPALRNRVYGSLVTSWADSDPRAAATFAVNRMTAGPDQDRALTGIIQRWAQIHPDEVRSWVHEFPDGPLKEGALERIQELATRQAGASEPP